MESNIKNANEIFDDFDGDDICDLDPSKMCDSCEKCLGLDISDYREIRLDGLINELSEVEEYILQDDTLSKSSDDDVVDSFEVQYIEDIPELKEEYDKKVNELLGRK